MEMAHLLHRKPKTVEPQKEKLLSYMYHNRILYFLVLPGLVYFIIFKIIPMFGIVIAFQDYVPYTGILHSEWVGWDNFRQFFMSGDFGRLLKNTLILAFLEMVISFPAPIILALLLNEMRGWLTKRFIQTAIYLPHFLSWTIVASLTMVLLNVDTGSITHLIESLVGHKVDILSSVHAFRPLIIIQSIWKGAGWGTIIYLAALAGVNPERYEAAIMDGAGRFQRMWHVTLPGIRSTVVIMLILRCGSILSSGFDQIYMMTNSMNRSVADVFDTYVYTVGITNGSFSYSTAVGLFKSLVGIILVLSTNKIARSLGEEGLY